MKECRFTTALLGLMMLFSEALVSEEADLEYKVKAGYLFRFTNFTVWPTVNSPTFNICILGNDPFGSSLDPIQDKLVGKQRIRIVRLSENDLLGSQNSIVYCQILYLGESVNVENLEKNHIIPRKGTLVVGEGESATDRVQTVSFVMRDNKIRFQINQELARASGLVFSAKLLELAELKSGKGL